MLNQGGTDGSKRKAATDNASTGDRIVGNLPVVTKKSKADEGEVPLRSLEAWSHYRDYLDSCASSTNGQQLSDTDGENGGAVLQEDNDGDFDELFEVIGILKGILPEPDTVEGLPQVDDLEKEGPSEQDVSAKCRTIKGLLPVLISMSYLHIGSHAISLALAEEQGGDGSMFSRRPEEYLTLSLQYFPYNAAAASMLANYLRMNMLAPVDHICNLYMLAANNASKMRSLAISLLDNETVGEEVKEWIELLLLNGIAGSEFADPEDGQEEEDSGDKEGNGKDQEEEEEEEEVTDSEVEATASFMASLLNSIQGKHEEALNYQKKFGITHRIHPNVWSGAKISVNDVVAKTAGDSPVPVPASFRSINGNGVLPEKQYKGLCDVFSPTSPYWKESDYDNRGYYSYFLDLTDDMRKSPKSIIEDVIVNHLLPLAKRGLSAEEGEKICGAEWWTHHRPIQANLGHQLHFDTDEALLAQEHAITHPILSSVLYLTGGSTGDTVSPAGSTIVFDQTPDSEQVASKVWTSQPRNNTFMIFPGDLLHGVLPCPGDEADAPQPSSEPPEHRLTFMVGFWTRRVPDKMTDRRLYGPCGPLPPSTGDHTWVQNIATGYGSGCNSAASSGRAEIVSFALPEMSPAWECLDKDGNRNIGSDGRCLEIPRGLDHRFFVQNAPHCFRDSLMNKDECF